MKNLTLIAAVGTALTLTACTLNDNRLALTPDQVGQDAGKEVAATEVGHPGAAIIKVDESLGTLLEKAGKEGLVHISKIANSRIARVEDVLQLGDVVRVICLGKDKNGKFSFSIKDCPK